MESYAYPNIELTSGALVKLEITHYDHGITHVMVGQHEDFPHLDIHTHREEIVQALVQQDWIHLDHFRYFEMQTERDASTGELYLQHYTEVPFREEERGLVPDDSRYVQRHTREGFQLLQREAEAQERVSGPHPQPRDPQPTARAPRPEDDGASQSPQDFLDRLGW